MATVLENSMRLHQLLLGRFDTFVGKGADREVKLLKRAIGDVKRRGFGPEHAGVQAIQKALDDVEALIKERPLRITVADTMGLGRKGAMTGRPSLLAALFNKGRTV